MQDRDESLCRQILGDDRDAARSAAIALVDAHYPRLYAYLMRLTHHTDDAQDLTQETFARVWASLGACRDFSHLTAWTHRIAYCAYVDWLRKSAPRAWPDTAFWDQIPAPGPGQAEQAAKQQESSLIWAAVERLPPEQRHAVHLHYYQGLSLRETAEVLEFSLSTLKNRLRDARANLRRTLLAQGIQAMPDASMVPTPGPLPASHTLEGAADHD